MPLVLDMFGVLLLPQGLNEPLLEICRFWREKGEKVFGASNMIVQQHIELWHNPAIRAAFDEVYCSGRLGASKPDPAFFALVTAKINVPPQDILFFDDSGTNVDAASRYGWQAHPYRTVSDLTAIADGFFMAQRGELKMATAPGDGTSPPGGMDSSLPFAN